MDNNSQYGQESGIYQQYPGVALSTQQSKNGQLRDRTDSITGSLKQTKSHEFFKSTRVESCPYVVVKNGVAQAVPFRPKPKQIDNTPLYSQSENQYTFMLCHSS